MLRLSRLRSKSAAALTLCAIMAMTATAAACSSDNPRVLTASEADFVPVIESSDIHTGMPRLVLTLLERDAQPQFGGDARFVIRYFEPTEGGIRFHSEADLQPIDVEGLRYLVADEPPFADSGQWALAVTVELPDGSAEHSPRLPFIVTETPSGLRKGDPAPTVETPTVDDGILDRMAEVSDDLMPLYERSAHELLEAGEPFLIVWASAERCAGRRACARALQQAQDIHRAGGIAVIHAEPFGRPRPAELQQKIDAANEAWSIEAEPQFFIVNAEGNIQARYEIVVEPETLNAAVASASLRSPS